MIFLLSGCTLESSIYACGEGDGTLDCTEAIPGWGDGTCEEGKCVVTACTDGFVVRNNQCESGCPNGEHLVEGECIKDTTSECGYYLVNCEREVPGWWNGTCTDGQCLVSECKSGYTFKNNQCESGCSAGQHLADSKCVQDTPKECGNYLVNCKLEVPGWSNGTCTNGQCLVSECISGYTFKNNQCEDGCLEGEHLKGEGCVPDSIEHCGDELTNCELELTGWASGECSKGKCIVSECKTGYIFNGKQCEPGCPTGQHLNEDRLCEVDSAKHCGTLENDCTASAGWLDGECENRKCVATKCEPNFEIKNNRCDPCAKTTHIYQPDESEFKYICEPNSLENCGSHGYQCTEKITGWVEGHCDEEKGECVVEKCQEGYSLIEGKCIVTSCPEGEHIYRDANVCEADSLENCGLHDYDCSRLVFGWKSGRCENGACVVDECQFGCEINDYGKCEAWYDGGDGECAVKCDEDTGYATFIFENKKYRAKCLYTAEDFLDFRDQINTLASYEDTWPIDNADSAYILMNDIDLGTQEEWIEVGCAHYDHLYSDKSPAYFYQKSFFGNNRIITGDLTCRTKGCGIFGYLSASRLDRIYSGINLYFDGDYISKHPDDEYASIVGNIAGSIASSIISNSTVVGTVQEKIIAERGDSTDRWLYVGGIAGFSRNSILQNNEFAGQIKGTGYTPTDVGGIFGGLAVSAKAVNTVDHCTVSGSIDITLDERCTITDSLGQSMSVNIGGICGYCRGTFKNNAVYGNISGVGAIGGVVGMLYADSEVDNNYVVGTITSHGGKAAGIVGTMFYETSSYTKSFTTKINSNAFLGNMVFDGSIENLTNYAGGVMTQVTGTLPIGHRFIVSNNLSVGNIMNASEASGIVGAFKASFNNNSQDNAYFALRNNWTAMRFSQIEGGHSNALTQFICPSGITCPDSIISISNNYYLDTELTQADDPVSHNLAEPSFSSNYPLEYADDGEGQLMLNAVNDTKKYLMLDRLNNPSVYHTTWRNMLCTQTGDGEIAEEFDAKHLLPIPFSLSPKNCEEAEVKIQ
ncbi:MAG: hypothetical protein IJU23_13065 [Proteobacteria bacterium]|nr:hypothetical protein [Pseudomonadota bacterium]